MNRSKYRTFLMLHVNGTPLFCVRSEVMWAPPFIRKTLERELLFPSSTVFICQRRTSWDRAYLRVRHQVNICWPFWATQMGSLLGAQRLRRGVPVFRTVLLRGVHTRTAFNSQQDWSRMVRTITEPEVAPTHGNKGSFIEIGRTVKFCLDAYPVIRLFCNRQIKVHLHVALESGSPNFRGQSKLISNPDRVCRNFAVQFSSKPYNLNNFEKLEIHTYRCYLSTEQTKPLRHTRTSAPT